MRVLENLEPKEFFRILKIFAVFHMDPEIRSRSVITV